MRNQIRIYPPFLSSLAQKRFERLSPKNDLAKAIHYMLTAGRRSSASLHDAESCLSNNAAERALRCVAVGRRNWTFAGSTARAAIRNKAATRS